MRKADRKKLLADIDSIIEQFQELRSRLVAFMDNEEATPAAKTLLPPRGTRNT
jgi:hypothetical protein